MQVTNLNLQIVRAFASGVGNKECSLLLVADSSSSSIYLTLRIAVAEAIPAVAISPFAAGWSTAGANVIIVL